MESIYTVTTIDTPNYLLSTLLNLHWFNALLREEEKSWMLSRYRGCAVDLTAINMYINYIVVFSIKFIV